MLLLQVLLAAAALCSYGAAQILRQPKPSVRRVAYSTARIDCHFSGSDFPNAYIHWYQQKPGEAPQHLLYVQKGAAEYYDQSYRETFGAEKKKTEPICTLTIKRVTKEQEATYYCAYRGDVKIFGTGTKLIVSDKGNSKPENSEILQTKHKDQLLYVCLIENFYPEVIRVQWVDEANKEVTKNVIKGDVWKSTNDKYSVSTWLTLPGNTTNKNYYCKYDHESQENFKLPIQDSSETPSQEEYCSTYSGNSTVFYKDYLMHKAAHLVYLVLLLKSSMYYVIVLFFIYRMRTPAKLPGKKT